MIRQRRRTHALESIVDRKVRSVGKEQHMEVCEGGNGGGALGLGSPMMITINHVSRIDKRC